jgi:hypothetical protein
MRPLDAPGSFVISACRYARACHTLVLVTIFYQSACLAQTISPLIRMQR